MKQPKLFWSMLVLTCLGLIFSGRLLVLDYQILFSAGYTPECNLNATFNCSVVAQSPYAFFAGIPVAAWGLLGYGVVLSYLLFNRKKNQLLPLLLIYSLFSLVSMYYFGVTKMQLQTICLYCLLTYLTNWLATGILAVASFFNASAEPPRLLDNLGLRSSVILCYALLTVAILVPSYLVFQLPQSVSAPLPHSAPLFVYPNGQFDTHQMLSTAGNEQGSVNLLVYSDYQCPFCSEFEDEVQQAMREFKNIRLIRKEFPLDNSCNSLLGKRQMHENACQAAYFAKCAGLQGKFWEAAQSLHKQHADLSRGQLQAVTKTLGLNWRHQSACMTAATTRQSVLNDIQEGQSRGINSTPGYLINGQKQSGVLPYAEFRALLIKAGGEVKTE